MIYTETTNERHKDRHGKCQADQRNEVEAWHSAMVMQTNDLSEADTKTQIKIVIDFSSRQTTNMLRE